MNRHCPSAPCLLKSFAKREEVLLSKFELVYLFGDGTSKKIKGVRTVFCFLLEQQREGWGASGFFGFLVRGNILTFVNFVSTELAPHFDTTVFITPASLALFPNLAVITHKHSVKESVVFTRNLPLFGFLRTKNLSAASDLTAFIDAVLS